MKEQLSGVNLDKNQFVKVPGALDIIPLLSNSSFCGIVTGRNETTLTSRELHN